MIKLRFMPRLVRLWNWHIFTMPCGHLCLAIFYHVLPHWCVYFRLGAILERSCALICIFNTIWVCLLGQLDAKALKVTFRSFAFPNSGKLRYQINHIFPLIWSCLLCSLPSPAGFSFNAANSYWIHVVDQAKSNSFSNHASWRLEDVEGETFAIKLITKDRAMNKTDTRMLI